MMNTYKTSFFKNMRGPICVAFLTVIISMIITMPISLLGWVMVGIGLIIVYLFSSSMSALLSWGTVYTFAFGLFIVSMGALICVVTSTPESSFLSYLQTFFKIVGTFLVLAVFLEYLLDEFYYTDVVVDYIGYALLSPIVNPRKRHLTNPETLKEWEGNSEVMYKVRNILNS